MKLRNHVIAATLCAIFPFVTIFSDKSDIDTVQLTSNRQLTTVLFEFIKEQRNQAKAPLQNELNELAARLSSPDDYLTSREKDSMRQQIYALEQKIAAIDQKPIDVAALSPELIDPQVLTYLTGNISTAAGQTFAEKLKSYCTWKTAAIAGGVASLVLAGIVIHQVFNAKDAKTLSEALVGLKNNQYVLADEFDKIHRNLQTITKRTAIFGEPVKTSRKKKPIKKKRSQSFTSGSRFQLSRTLFEVKKMILKKKKKKKLGTKKKKKTELEKKLNKLQKRKKRLEELRRK